MRETNTKAPASRASIKEMCHMLGRVVRYITQYYKWSFLIVILCILGSSLVTRRGTLFMQTLIDDYIVPLTQSASPDYGPLAHALFIIACITPWASSAPTPTTGSW